MDGFQRKLRWLIAAGSAVGFIGGWGLLAHAGKPATDGQTPAISIPSQLPPIDFRALESTGSSSGLQALPALRSAPAFGFSRLRSGGS